MRIIRIYLDWTINNVKICSNGFIIKYALIFIKTTPLYLNFMSDYML